MITDIYISESFLSSNNRKQITRRKDKDDMGKLKYYSMTPNDKPEWLLRLQFEVSQHYALRGIEDTPEDWLALQDFVDAFIRSLYVRKDINVRSDVAADLLTEDGETRLIVKRNGKPLQVEKPLYFDPFGQIEFAPVGHNIIAPCKVLVQGSILFYPFRDSGFS